MTNATRQSVDSRSEREVVPEKDGAQSSTCAAGICDGDRSGVQAPDAGGGGH